MKEKEIVKIEVVVVDFVKELTSRKKKPLTIDAYTRNVRDFHKALNICTLEELQKVNRKTIVAYFDSLADHYAPASINNKIATLKTYYKFLVYYGYVKKNLVLYKDKVSVPTPKPQFLEIDEMLELLDTCNKLKECHKKNAIRDSLVIEICLNLGLRIFEVRDLTLSNIDADNWSVTVIGKNDVERTVFLADRTISTLKEWLEVRDKINIKEGYEEFLFISSWGLKISKRRLQQIVEEYVQLADITKVSSHKLRHTFATIMVGNGTCSDEELQSMMGHKNKKTTEGYRHALQEGLKKSRKMVGFC